MATTVKFTKMHGLGNDFIVIDGITQNVRLSPEQVQKMADRHLGIGCDQILLLIPPNQPDLDFNCLIYNADGTRAEQCGNGIRCIARFAKEAGLVKKRNLKIGTTSTVMAVDLLDATTVKVNLGTPKFESPYPTSIQLLGTDRSLYFVNLGNPHAVLLTQNLAECDLHAMGAALQTHPACPDGINFSIATCLARNHLKMQVYERGVGETRACGSAACAAVVAGHLDQSLGETVKVDMPGGALDVEWPHKNATIKLIGPATIVYHGQCLLSQMAPRR